MQLVTLTTDWGYKDFFSGMVKGKLYSHIDDCQIIDISHGIEPYNINDAIIVAKNTCPSFPEGTIHIIDVDSYESDAFSHVVIKSKGHYFICTDNGIPYGIFGDSFEEAYRITIFQDSNFFTFAALDLFAKVAGLIASGTPLEEIGEPVHELQRLLMSDAPIKGNILNATVIYVDNYGNAYLNLLYDRFMEIEKGRKFSIQIKGQKDNKAYVSQSYADVENGEYVLTVSATGFMQIAINRGAASKLLGLNLKDVVIFEFKD